MASRKDLESRAKKDINEYYAKEGVNFIFHIKLTDGIYNFVANILIYPL